MPKKLDTVLVLGAGFSQPTGGPLSKDLLTDPFIRASAAKPQVLRELAGALLAQPEFHVDGRPSIERMFTRIYQLAGVSNEINILGKSRDAAGLLSQLEIHLSSVTGAISTDFRTTLGRSYASYLASLSKTSRSLTVVSFNYDLLLEQVAMHDDLVYNYGRTASPEFEDKRIRSRLRRYLPDLRVLKLHGSANWGICSECGTAARPSTISVYQSPYVPARKRRCLRCGSPHFAKSGVVPPLEVKSSEVRPLARLWVEARESAATAERAIVIGYSLPPADAEAQDLVLKFAGGRLQHPLQVICGSGDVPKRFGALLGQVSDEGRYFDETPPEPPV